MSLPIVVHGNISQRLRHYNLKNIIRGRAFLNLDHGLHLPESWLGLLVNVVISTSPFILANSDGLIERARERHGFSHRMAQLDSGNSAFDHESASSRDRVGAASAAN